MGSWGVVLEQSRPGCPATTQCTLSTLKFHAKSNFYTLLFTWAGYHGLNWKQTSWDSVSASVCVCGEVGIQLPPFICRFWQWNVVFISCYVLAGDCCENDKLKKTENILRKNNQWNTMVTSFYTFVHRHKQYIHKERSINTWVKAFNSWNTEGWGPALPGRGKGGNAPFKTEQFQQMCGCFVDFPCNKS